MLELRVLMCLVRGGGDVRACLGQHGTVAIDEQELLLDPTVRCVIFSVCSAGPASYRQEAPEYRGSGHRLAHRRRRSRAPDRATRG